MQNKQIVWLAHQILVNIDLLKLLGVNPYDWN